MNNSFNSLHSTSNLHRRSFAKACASVAVACQLSPWSFAQDISPTKNTQQQRWELDISAYSKMLLPREHGQLTSTMQFIQRRYPSRDHCMQMAAFFSKTSGIVVLSNDPTAGVSDWTIVPGKRLIIDFYGKMPDVKVIPIEPTIQAAANIYRNWAKEQFWMKNNSRKRPLLNFMSVASGSNIQVDQKHFAELSNFINAPMGVFLTQWRKSPFDIMYPDYTPKEPLAFQLFLRHLRNRGAVPFPYINGLTWDKNNLAFSKTGEEVAVRNKEQKVNFYTETMPHLIYACPYTQRWQDEIIQARNGLLDIEGDASTGVYLDMLAATSPILCWSENHGHAPGDRYSWMNGIRNLLQRVTGNIFIEGCAEVYLDLIDYPLMHLHTAKPDSVPLWNSVYGEISSGWGWRLPQGISYDEFKKILPMIKKFGVSGVGSPWMTNEHERELVKRQLLQMALRKKIAS